MTRSIPSARPAAVLNAIATLRRRLDSASTVATESDTATGWTDAMPRWIALAVAYTDFNGTAATTATKTVTTLPPGAVWTQERIDVATTFVSAGSIWRMTIAVPTGGASAGGTAKAPDVTTPDALAQRAANEYVVSDPAGVCDVVISIDSGGGDLATTLTQGSATVNILASVPGSTSDTLPHA